MRTTDWAKNPFHILSLSYLHRQDAFFARLILCVLYNKRSTFFVCTCLVVFVTKYGKKKRWNKFFPTLLSSPRAVRNCFKIKDSAQSQYGTFPNQRGKRQHPLPCTASSSLNSYSPALFPSPSCIMEHTSDANIATVGDNVTDDDTHSTESLPLIRSASISYLRAEACAPMEDEQGFFVEARMDQVPIVDMTKVQGNCKHVLHRTFFFGILPLLIRTLEEWRRRWGTMPRFPPNGLISYLASIMDLQTRTLLPDNAVTTPPCICENRSSTTCVSHIYDCWWEVRGGQDRGEREKEPYCNCLLSRRPEVGVFIAAPLIMRKFISRELRQDTVLLEKEEEFCSIPPPLIGKSVRGENCTVGIATPC